MKVLNKHAPLKCKYIRANEGSFMNKELRKAIMVRSKLRNRLNNDKTWSANVAYRRQRNLCTSLLRKTKRKYYENLKPSEISDNKKFWKVTKPLFSNKIISKDNISIIDNNHICEDDRKISEIFNTFFSNAVDNLSIERTDLMNSEINESDPILMQSKSMTNI